MPELDFSLTFALRTVFTVTVQDINIGTLNLDLPAFDMEVETLSKKMSDCSTPPAGTPADQIYDQLIHLSGSLDAVLSYSLLEDESEGVLANWTIWDAVDECYAFLPGAGKIGPVPASSDSPKLVAPKDNGPANATSTKQDGPDQEKQRNTFPLLTTAQKGAIGSGKSSLCLCPLCVYLSLIDCRSLLRRHTDRSYCMVLRPP
jgi:hypothetical protein